MVVLSARTEWNKALSLAAAILLALASMEPHGIAQEPAPSGASVAAPDAAWLADLAQWRTARETEIDAPDGWLTLVALEWLKPGTNAVGASEENPIRLHGQAPDHLANFVVSTHGVELQPPAGGFPAGLEVDGKEAQPDPLTVDGIKPSVIRWQNLTLVVLSRGDRYALRVKDANSPTRASFHGLNWYAPDAHFRVQAKWIPFTPARTEKIPTVIGTTLLENPDGQELFFILRDQTRYDTTYEAARFLHTGLPDHGLSKPGTLTLDFNRLENPPCAYTAYATCPLPPEGNRLLVRLEAGEKRYSH